MITALSVLANERQPLLARGGSPRAFRHWCNADAFRQAGGSWLAVKPVAVKEQTQFGDPEISFQSGDGCARRPHSNVLRHRICVELSRVN
jgi:hypothetical protein